VVADVEAEVADVEAEAEVEPATLVVSDVLLAVLTDAVDAPVVSAEVVAAAVADAVVYPEVSTFGAQTMEEDVDVVDTQALLPATAVHTKDPDPTEPPGQVTVQVAPTAVLTPHEAVTFETEPLTVTLATNVAEHPVVLEVVVPAELEVVPVEAAVVVTTGVVQVCAEVFV